MKRLLRISFNSAFFSFIPVLSWFALGIIVDKNLTNVFTLTYPIQFIWLMMKSMFGTGANISKEKDKNENAVLSGMTLGIIIGFFLFGFILLNIESYIKFMNMDVTIYKDFAIYSVIQLYIQLIFAFVLEKLYFENKNKLANKYCITLNLLNFIVLVISALLFKNNMTIVIITLLSILIYVIIVTIKSYKKFKFNCNVWNFIKYDSVEIFNNFAFFLIFLFGLSNALEYGEKYAIALTFVALITDTQWDSFDAISTVAKIDISQQTFNYKQHRNNAYKLLLILCFTILIMFIALYNLYELDWWISSQWENIPMRKNYGHVRSDNGVLDKGYMYHVLREQTELKECYGLRYADDFRIFCRNRQDAEKLFIATQKWLKERLGLDISPEKSKIVNLKKQYSEFLGFKIKVKPKGRKNGKAKYTIVSHVSDKRKEKIKKRATDMVEKIKFPANENEEHKFIMDYNSYVLGIHNYYRIATHVSRDFAEIGFSVKRTMKCRLGQRLMKSGNTLPQYVQKMYGRSKELRYIRGLFVLPITYVQTIPPKHRARDWCIYTPEGRADIHKTLDTSGFCDNSTFKKLLSVFNLVYFDLKLIDDEEHKKYTGVSNKIILENLQILDESNVPYHIRIPLIPDITDTKKNLDEIKNVILNLKNKPLRIDPLPYNILAGGKYDAYDMKYGLEDLKKNNNLQNIDDFKHCMISNGFKIMGDEVKCLQNA